MAYDDDYNLMLLRALNTGPYKASSSFVNASGFTPLYRAAESEFIIDRSLDKVVEVAGVEPAVPGAADLQSAGVTNFPTLP